MSSIDELRCIINEELAKIKYPKDPSLLYNIGSIYEIVSLLNHIDSMKDNVINDDIY